MHMRNFPFPDLESPSVIWPAAFLLQNENCHIAHARYDVLFSQQPLPPPLV